MGESSGSLQVDTETNQRQQGTAFRNNFLASRGTASRRQPVIYPVQKLCCLRSVTWNGETLDGARIANGGYVAYIIFRGNGMIRAERMLVFLRR